MVTDIAATRSGAVRTVSEQQNEMIRRQRLGDLRKLFRDRYGPILPDDDAGHDDLYELLLPISLGPNADLKMRHAIEVWAPWMGQQGIQGYVDLISQTPLWQRKPKAGLLGKRLNLTYATRTRLRIKTIQCCDISRAAVALLQKRKKRERDRLRRQLRGQQSRGDYLATSISQTKPWIAAGISRATWYRQQRETSPRRIKLTKAEPQPVSPQQAATPKRKRLSEQTTTNQVRVTTPNTQNTETPAMDTANELKAPTCLTAAEQNGNDLRGMPADLSSLYPRIPSYDGLMRAIRSDDVDIAA